jgi:hypothetical protein
MEGYMKSVSDSERQRIALLVKEIKQLKNYPCGHSFKRRHSYLKRHRSCRNFGGLRAV